MPDVICISASTDETRAIAAALSSALQGGDIVVLSGDLGAGKTAFVQGAAEGLGVRAHVTSPSFVLVREYAGRARVVHVDVYRLSSLQELIDLGYEELFAPDAVTFIEWGDAVSGALPDDRVEVDLRASDDETRRITISARGPTARARLEAMPLGRWVVAV
jgi:tRNA threonylcarbamoyladenosine biosynthesis protein TsaE